MCIRDRIERISREHGAKCTIADASEAEVLKESCLGQTIRYMGEEYEIPLAGVYQKENAVVALNALKVLDELGFPTAAEQKKEGLRTVNWNGRFTVCLLYTSVGYNENTLLHYSNEVPYAQKERVEGISWK